MGSSVHDFVGEDMMTRRTLSSEQTMRKSLNVELARRVDVAGGASAVIARTYVTLLSKNVMKASDSLL